MQSEEQRSKSDEGPESITYLSLFQQDISHDLARYSFLSFRILIFDSHNTLLIHCYNILHFL